MGEATYARVSAVHRDEGGLVFALRSRMANQQQNQGYSPQAQQIEESTGTPNMEYDLISILYHSLQGAETYSCYLEDAQAIGDEELIGFIHEVIDQERQRAEKVKRILLRHLGGARGMARDQETQDAGM
jgi:hypothetical protein